DKIRYGESAYMHLHVFDDGSRRSGHGAACVRKSVEIYFDQLKLERLFCEPNAFNVAPNRTLQKAGFRYVKTHMTVPAPLTFRQAVTQWVSERHRGARNSTASTADSFATMSIPKGAPGCGSRCRSCRATSSPGPRPAWRGSSGTSRA